MNVVMTLEDFRHLIYALCFLQVSSAALVITWVCAYVRDRTSWPYRLVEVSAPTDPDLKAQYWVVYGRGYDNGYRDATEPDKAEVSP
jgi:hypothetical protein